MFLVEVIVLAGELLETRSCLTNALYVATAPKRLEGIVDLIETDTPLFERRVSVMANHNMIENIYAQEFSSIDNFPRNT